MHQIKKNAHTLDNSSITFKQKQLFLRNYFLKLLRCIFLTNIHRPFPGETQ